MERKNPLLKKSKQYVKNLLLVICTIIIIIFLLTIIVLSILEKIELKEYLTEVISGFLGTLIIYTKNSIENLNDSAPWETYLTFLLRKKIISKKDYVRISYAAFMIVEVDGSYLLLKNAHGINLYHLPSYTYPLTNDEALKIEIQFGALNDDFIKRDYRDYRFLMPVKKLKAFYKYFCENVNPYTTNYQYIVDSMVSKCHLNNEIFNNSKILFKNRIIKKIDFSRYTNQYEMNVMDVCILCPTDEQLEELRKIKSNVNELYRFSTLNEIKSNGINKEKGQLYADIATNVYDCFIEE